MSQFKADDLPRLMHSVTLEIHKFGKNDEQEVYL